MGTKQQRFLTILNKRNPEILKGLDEIVNRSDEIVRRELRKFDTYEDALAAGFKTPMGNGEYSR